MEQALRVANSFYTIGRRKSNFYYLSRKEPNLGYMGGVKHSNFCYTHKKVML